MERVKKEENMRLSEFRAGTILVDGYGKVFIHDGFLLMLMDMAL